MTASNWPTDSARHLQPTGQPLGDSTKSFMESRFGVPFDDVRVHTGSRAVTAAEALNARAFTLGNDIFFGRGQYAPNTDVGRRLLAHELVHVVQQRGLSAEKHPDWVTLGDPNDPLETEAELVAAEVCASGRMSKIHRDTGPAIRRFIFVDAASATITVDPGVSKAKPAVDIVNNGESLVALAHLTAGVNAAQVVTSGIQGIEPVIKMVGKFDVIIDPGDDASLPGFRFGFIQIGNVFVLEDTYVGRTLNDGHIILRHRSNVSPTILLDTIASFFPFSNRVGTAVKPVQQAEKRILAQTIELGILPGKTGDSPMSKSRASLHNSATDADNFLFEMRADLGFTTVLVAIDPKNKVQALAHVGWHLVWHFQFKWKGSSNPTFTVIPINSQAIVEPVSKRSLAVTDPTVAALVATPKGPFFNEVTTAAKFATVLGQRPNREDNFSRPGGIPNDFFT